MINLKGMRAKPGMFKQRKNTHKYVKLDTYCKCGNNKFKLIKSINELECSKCKTYRGK